MKYEVVSIKESTFVDEKTGCPVKMNKVFIMLDRGDITYLFTRADVQPGDMVDIGIKLKKGLPVPCIVQ